MKWFDRWFMRKFQWAWDNRHVYQTATPSMPVEDDPHELIDGMRIAIKKVVGGSLVTFKSYDKRADRMDNRTYIITADQDFNTELGKIITMESMR